MPLSNEDAHQSITSVTFHQRDNNLRIPNGATNAHPAQDMSDVRSSRQRAESRDAMNAPEDSRVPLASYQASHKGTEKNTPATSAGL